MDIAVHLEGGAGDCILGTRFIPAILEKHPGAKIHAFLNTEGNPFQENLLRLGYGRFFESLATVPSKLYREFWVDTQFGPDNFTGSFANLPLEYQGKIQSFPVWYDLHIDSLKWLNYDFDWLNWLYHFPRPDVPPVPEKDAEAVSKLPEKFIVCNLVSESSGAHRLETWYLTGLIRRLATKFPVVLLSTPKVNQFYEEVAKLPNVALLNVELAALFSVIAKASLMVSTDTGLKYIAYGFGVPTLEFSAQSNAPHQVLPSHELRWLLFPKRCFPPHFDHGYVADCAFRIVEDRGHALMPNIHDIDNQLVRRKWTLNKEKSVLNA